MPSPTRAVVLGCGQVGARLATRLAAAKYDCAVIDHDQGAFLQLPEEFAGTTVEGDGLDREILVRAGIEGAGVFVATAANDNFNLMAAQVVKVRFKVPQVVVRVYDPDKAALYADLGLLTYCPTRETVTAMERLLAGTD